jgi:hypothetical protein
VGFVVVVAALNVLLVGVIQPRVCEHFAREERRRTLTVTQLCNEAREVRALIAAGRAPRTGNYEPVVHDCPVCSGRAVGACMRSGDVPLDGWGQHLVFRSPGPAHRHGWDLYSVGPNGIDEQGLGDDLLVGEDLASVISR